MPHRITRTLIALWLLGVVGAVAVSTKAVAQQAVPIADALENFHKYDFFMVEGTIVDSQNQFLYRIEDETGRMPIYIKEHMVREHGEIKRGDRLRVWGRYETKKLDSDVQGMMVSRLYRLPDQVGATGASNPGADTSAEVVPVDRSALPAAPSVDPGDVIKPMASEEFKQRARAALRAYRDAEGAAVAAGEAYARAARESGSNGQVEAEALKRLEAAEAHVVETRGAIPALINEGREAGIDEGLLQMIEHEAGLR